VNIKAEFKILLLLSPKELLWLPIATIFYLLLKIADKIIRINIYGVSTDRIGHFAMDTEVARLAAAERKSTGAREINLFCSRYTQNSNDFLAKMWKRELFYISGPLGSNIVKLAAKNKKCKLLKELDPHDRNGLMAAFPNSLRFTNKEINEGKSFLKKMGVETDQPFVCLLVRDSVYLEKTKRISWSKSRDWSYHNYRNSDIDTYVDAAESLAEAGYHVFRMGAIVEKKLQSNHPFVHDYANSGLRSPFLDIFLGAYCAFSISTGSGWCSIPDLFRRPKMLVNHLPMINPVISLSQIVYPKLLIDKKSGRELSFSDAKNRQVLEEMRIQEYIDNGVEIRVLSSEELVQAVTEMAARVEGRFVPTEQQESMQKKLRHKLMTEPTFQTSPGILPVNTEFASCFLSNYPNFLD